MAPWREQKESINCLNRAPAPRLRTPEVKIPHLLLDVSSHGYGHLAQSAPVVNALAHQVPDLTLTVRTDLPARLLHERLAVPLEQIATAPDPSLVMVDALTIDRAASLERYRAFHAHWEADVAGEARWLSESGFDLILADIPYRSLAAAARAEIPAAAVCSLDWAGIFAHYWGTAPGAETIHDQILAAYRSARVFLQPEPHMPMDYLSNRVPVGPIPAEPRFDPDKLRARIAGDRRLGLVSLGGIPFDLDPARWPEDPETLWIVPSADPHRPDQVDLAALGVPPWSSSPRRTWWSPSPATGPSCRPVARGWMYCISPAVTGRKSPI